MADTSTLQTTPPKKEGIRPNIIGLIDDTFETIARGTGDFVHHEGSFESKEPIKTPVPEYVKKTFASGSIENFDKPHPKSEEALITEQRAAIAGAEDILRQSRAASIIQEEIRNGVAGMSEEERNRKLGLNTSLRIEHTQTAYHMAELYRQVKRKVSVIKQQKEDTGIPSPAKQPSALEGAFEGRSGNQGGGQANLSAHAVG